MPRTKLPTVISFTILLLLLAPAHGADRIIIDPVVKNFDSIPEVNTKLKFFVETVRDTAQGRADSGVVGYAHATSKQPVAIVCKPLPAAVVQQTLEALFAKKGVRAPDPSHATYLVRVALLEFGLKETPHFLYQTIEASVRFEAELADPGAAQPPRKFIIESRRSRTAFDASHKAEVVTRDALESGLAELVRMLNGL
jgi:hypothetical protein